jgi:selenocysteine lyase/cysteine desulfurase
MTTMTSMTTVAPSNVEEQVSALRAEIVGIEQQVPLLDGSRRPCVYLDNAASTPALRSVRDKVDELLEWYSSVHRGTSFKSLLSSEAYEQAREIVAEFVGADKEHDVVIFGKNTSEAINKLAYRLPLAEDDVVLTTVMEHHSNDLPWRAHAQVEHLELNGDGDLELELLERRLQALQGRVKLVAVTGASNVSGYAPPVYEMAELAHEYGAMILVDCAQLAPHRAVHMGKVGSPQRLDFVAISGHKMYAPYGCGALVGPRELFRQGAPEYQGGGTIDLVSLSEVLWTEPPERDEVGSPNLLGAVALAASIRRLSQVGMELIAEHEKALTSYALRRMSELPGIEIYGSRDPERLEDRLGVITFNVQGMYHGKVASILGFEGGIAVRHGCFCAHPYVLRLLDMEDAEYEQYRQQVLRGERSQMPGMVRVSFGCYNTTEDVDYLMEMLQRVVSGTYAGEYVYHADINMYVPQGFDMGLVGEMFTL